MSIIRLLLILFIFAGCTSQKNSRQQIPEHSQFSFAPQTLSLKLESQLNILRAKVTSNKDYNYPLTFKWKLNENTILISGPKSGKIDKLLKNQELIFELVVQNWSDKNRQFAHFEITGLDNRQIAYAQGVLSSQKQQSFEKIVQEVEAYKEHHEQK